MIIVVDSSSMNDCLCMVPFFPFLSFQSDKRLHHSAKPLLYSVQDKRVKTALRRLLNERLFGNTDKKKSRRDDDNADTLTNADSVGNNVSDASSVVGTRSRLRHSVAPVTVSDVLSV